MYGAAPGAGGRQVSPAAQLCLDAFVPINGMWQLWNEICACPVGKKGGGVTFEMKSPVPTNITPAYHERCAVTRCKKVDERAG